MSNYNPSYVFVPSTPIFSGQVNANFTGAAAVINGQLDTTNLKASANIVGTQLSASASILGSQLASNAGILPGQLAFSVAALINNGRLYGVTGSPYADTSSSGTTTIYFGPTFMGNYIAIENTGTGLLMAQTFTEASLSVAGLTTATAYDVYASSASTTTVSLSTAAWSGNTPPTRGTDITGRQTASGNAGALLVGAIYILSGTTYDYTARRLISNVFNRIDKYALAQDTTSSWVPNTSSFGASNSNTTDGVGRINTFSVAALQPISTFNSALVQPADTAGDYVTIGTGLNSTTVASASSFIRQGSITTTSPYFSICVPFTSAGLIGLNYFQRLDAYVGTSGFIFGGNPVFANAGACTYLEAIITC